MSSRKEKNEGFRPYYKDGEENSTDASLKEITFMPSTIETIDFALNDWLEEELGIFCTTNEGAGFAFVGAGASMHRCLTGCLG